MTTSDRVEAARQEGAALVWIPDKYDEFKTTAGDNYKAEFPDFENPFRWLRKTCRVKHPVPLDGGDVRG